MNWGKVPRLRPPLFAFESQAVLGLVCVLCKCRVGGERLISGIAEGGCGEGVAVRAGRACGLAGTEVGGTRGPYQPGAAGAGPRSR